MLSQLLKSVAKQWPCIQWILSFSWISYSQSWCFAHGQTIYRELHWQDPKDASVFFVWFSDPTLHHVTALFASGCVWVELSIYILMHLTPFLCTTFVRLTHVVIVHSCWQHSAIEPFPSCLPVLLVMGPRWSSALKYHKGCLYEPVMFLVKHKATSILEQNCQPLIFWL